MMPRCVRCGITGSRLVTEPALTRDAFLGGKLMLWQPRKGYRAGVDPVLLAASVPANPGQSVLDLGCGVGTAALCIGARVRDITLAGVERDRDTARIAMRNAQENNAEMDVVHGDLAEFPAQLRQRQFDHVIANPPYFQRDRSSAAPDAKREAAQGEVTPLDIWVGAAAKRVRTGGTVTFVHRAERLPDLLNAFSVHLGSIELKPLAPRHGRESQLVLLRGRKGGRAAFRLYPPLVLHKGSEHVRDGADYTDQVELILRSGGALNFNCAS